MPIDRRVDSAPVAKARVFHHPGLHLLRRAIYVVTAADVTDDLRRSVSRGLRQIHADAFGQILPYLGDEPIASLVTDYARLIQWLRDMRGRVSAARARNVFFTLRIFFDVAVIEGWLRASSNPLRNDAVIAELPALPSAKKRANVVLSFETAQALISCDHVPLERRARYAVAFTTGQADGETSGLTWADLSEGDSLLHVRQAYQVVPSRKGQVGKTKNEHRERACPLHPCARAALLQWREEGAAPLLFRDPLPTDPIFPDRHGRHYRPHSALLLRVDLTAAGQPDSVNGKAATYHALRRSFATELRKRGVAEDIRKRLMGHARASVTDAHYTDELLAEQSEAVARLPLVWGVVPPVVLGVVPIGTSNGEN